MQCHQSAPVQEKEAELQRRFSCDESKPPLKITEADQEEATATLSMIAVAKKTSLDAAVAAASAERDGFLY